MSQAAPGALILDWGGVLTTPMNASFERWMELEGIDRESFRRHMRSLHNEPGSALHLVERGHLTASEFEAEVASGLRTASGSPVRPDGLLARMMAHLEHNEPVRLIVDSARAAGWRTAVLSNSWGNDYDLQDLESIVEIVLLSQQINERKPDPAAFLLAARAVDTDPQHCVFVDDLRRNVAGAQAVGMRAVLYHPGAEEHLEAALGLVP
ncbi:MAG: HAD family phosphatase [Actinomycetota bacterium]|nr:HAD family phosphatase [Actinomycetota bacterium]